MGYQQRTSKMHTAVQGLKMHLKPVGAVCYRVVKSSNCISMLLMDATNWWLMVGSVLWLTKTNENMFYMRIFPILGVWTKIVTCHISHPVSHNFRKGGFHPLHTSSSLISFTCSLPVHGLRFSSSIS